MRNSLLLSITILFMFSSIASAEVIYLKGGDIIRGVIASQDAQGVTVKVGSKYKKYYASQIDRVEKEGQMKEFDFKNINLSKLEGISAHKAALIAELMRANGVLRILKDNISKVIGKASLDKREEFKQLFDINGLVEKIIPIYASYFNEKEIEEMTAFYTTPAGRKSIEYQPEINQALVPAIAEYFSEKYNN